MAALLTAEASLAFHQVPVRRFERYEVAIEAMADYETELCRSASQKRARCLRVTDQDQPEEAFCLFPPGSNKPPLAIVGGMGPLAGAMAFRQACARFGNSRAVLLYQACSVPDRSTVILSGNGRESLLCRGLASRLAGAVRLSVSFVSSAVRPVRCILACNSAHYFWRILQDELNPDEAQMVSLVESSVEALRFRPCQRVLLLTTEGARAGKVFSTPLSDAGIAFAEPPHAQNLLLMRAIFEGIKSLDYRRAVELGNQFFENILEADEDYDGILAGCTEIPLIIDLLKLHGSRQVAAFLSRAKIVDPLMEALCRA